MATPRLAQLLISGLVVGGPDKRPRLSRLLISGTPGSGNKRPRISRLVISGTMALRRPRISRLTLTGTIITATIARAGADQTVEPGTLVTVNSSASTGTGTLTHTWEITSGGSGITLDGTGTQRTFTAPREWQGRTIDLRVTVSGTDGTAVDTVTITVRPHQMWFLNSAGVFTPVQHSFLRI